MGAEREIVSGGAEVLNNRVFCFEIPPNTTTTAATRVRTNAFKVLILKLAREVSGR